VVGGGGDRHQGPNSKNIFRFWICIDPVGLEQHLYLRQQNLSQRDSGATLDRDVSRQPSAASPASPGSPPIRKSRRWSTLPSTHGKVAKSTDFGVTWQALATLARPRQPLEALPSDPRNSQNLYVSRKFGQGCFASNNVAADCAAFRRVDGGLMWRNVARQLPPAPRL